jgi:hypothetical protein
MSVKKEKLEGKFFFMFNKKFNIPNSISISFLILNNSIRFLILKNNSGVKKYIKIPNFIVVEKNKKILNFKYTKELQTSIFFRIFKILYQELKYKIFETILIRGVGLKVILIDKPSIFLELRLGYRHKILLTVPKSINVIVKKKKFLVEGSDKVLVGNFVNKIINFKSLNNYTGKGLWLKSYQKFILKEIKKI